MQIIAESCSNTSLLRAILTHHRAGKKSNFSKMPVPPLSQQDLIAEPN